MNARLSFVPMLASILVLMLSTLSAADASIFQEDFNGTLGADISTLGWANQMTTVVKISDNVIDSGYSAASATLGDWYQYRKFLSSAYVLSTGQTAGLSAVVHAAGGLTGIALIRNMGGPLWRVYVSPGESKLKMYLINSAGGVDESQQVVISGASSPLDILISTTRDVQTSFSYRAHGTTGWTQAAVFAQEFNSVQGVEVLGEYLTGPSYIDTMEIVIPEPIGLVTLACGILGLGGRIIRRRR